MKDTLHLAKRFFASLMPGAPQSEHELWALSHLNEGTTLLWARMGNPDRRHAIEVARGVLAELGEDCSSAVVVAALMHDVGKVVSDYRTPARVVATAVWIVLPDRLSVEWCAKGKPLRRLGQYRQHPSIGEALLEGALAPKLACQWAGDHHKPQAEWRVEGQLGGVLKSCDDV